MFRKPFKVKSNTAIKGSQRRKLKEAVAKHFPNVAEYVTSVIPNKEEINVMKISSYHNEDINCYTLNKNPIFFEKDGMLIPTVYVLWNFPDLLALSFGTSSFVFDKMTSGADLFMNGVTHFSLDHQFDRKALCSIHVGDNRAAVGVGVTDFSYDQIVADGREGKKIHVFHLFEDCLWGHGEKLKLPFIEMPKISPNNDLYNNTDEKILPETETGANNEAFVETENNTTEDDVDAITSTENCNQSSENPNNDSSMEKENDDQGADETEIQPESQKSPQELMDDLLSNCFCQAILDARKAELPLLVSTFTSQYLYPVCPEDSRIDVKKSSYKKMSKFLSTMKDKEVIGLKELSKGVESIIAINVDSPLVFEYKRSEFATRVKLAKELKMKEEEENAKENSKQIFIIEMYGVSGKTLPLFKLFDISKGTTLLANDVRKYLGDYVRANNLVDPKNKKQIILDALLTDVLCNKNNIVEAMTWDVMMKRILGEMNDCYELSLPNRKPVVKKGKVKPIEICVEQRMGNKKVTILKNLDMFGIDLKKFAMELQQAAASSTSLIDAPGKTNAQYIQVQGLQHKHVKSLLETYEIPRKYIVGLENTGGRSKKR